MPETPTSESAEEMRLIDHVAFSEIVNRYDDGTGEASERIERLREALRHHNVDPVTLESQEHLNDLKRAIRTVYLLDAGNDDGRWCEHGFRHGLSDGMYRWNSTITILSQTYNLPYEERQQQPNTAWNVNKALLSLILHLEGAAELIDRLCHISGGSNSSSAKLQMYAYAWEADILTNVQLEISLKTLWVLRNLNGNPKTQLRHNFRKMWEALQDDHDSIMDHLSALPIMFKCLSPRDAVENAVQWAFDSMPEDEWVESRYWATSDWDKRRVSMPFHKFWISLGVYCVAKKVSTGRL